MLNQAQLQEHLPVLLPELVEGLAVVPGGLYIDCTVGGGGHAGAVLEASSPGGRLLGIDADPGAIRAAERRLRPFVGAFALVNDNFADLAEIARKYGFGRVNGIYFDLGLSSLQLEEAGRGFTFQRDDPLDMRFSDRQQRTAADLVNHAPVEELAEALRTYGEEPRSWTIARRIVAARPVGTTGQLALLVAETAGRGPRRIHPATRTFQAVRIWVNDELGSLERALKQALPLLGSGGRIAAISYHSLEDRIVKTIFHQEARDCICPPRLPACVCSHKAVVRLVTKKVLAPSRVEIERNPRSRSAKMRIAEKL